MNQRRQIEHGRFLRTASLTITAARPPSRDQRRVISAEHTRVISRERRSPADDPPQRPAPLEIDLVLENGSWRIADARMTPLPAWWTKQHEEPQPTFPGEEPAPLPRPPTLAQTAATYRMPPASFKR